MDQKIVFSGIKPSGNLHLGNYIGAISQWVKSQNDGLNIFCIVDLHAITVPQEPKELYEQTLQLAALIIASGIDPTRSILFVQSQNPDHTNLGWILNCYLSMGQMNRMTQYKEKSNGKDSVSVGLFDYPALMAADILLYDTTHVPVGEDQKQHVELTRDVAEKFNNKYGDTFVLPKPVIPQVGGRVMSLTNPTKKMSKSVDDPMGTIGLLDTKIEVQKKIMSAVTDSENSVKHDKARVGISNLIDIYSHVSGKTITEIEKEFDGVGYGEFKKAVFESVWTFLESLQTTYNELRGGNELSRILHEGVVRANKISHRKLTEIYSKIGFLV